MNLLLESYLNHHLYLQWPEKTCPGIGVFRGEGSDQQERPEHFVQAPADGAGERWRGAGPVQA